jgi:hypothetical protein
MRLKDITEIIDGQIVCGEERLTENFDVGFASDLMSDVLTLQSTNFLLITGLVNIQTIRTAEMADINCIILVRKKKALPEILEMARLALKLCINAIQIQHRKRRFYTCRRCFERCKEKIKAVKC